MADTVDRAVYEVETRRVGDRNAITAIDQELKQSAQLQAYLAKTQGAYEREVAAEASKGLGTERERTRLARENLALLSLRVRNVQLASAGEVAALQGAIAAESARLAASNATELQRERLISVEQRLEQRIDAQAVAQQRQAAAATRAATAQAQAAEQAAAAQARANAQLNAFPTQRLRTGANAVSSIAFAAEQSALGGRQAVIAFGNLATTLSFVSQSAKFASWAGGIGAAVVVAGTLASLLSRIGKEERDREEARFKRQLGDADVHTAERLLTVLKEQKKELEGIRQSTAAGRLTQRVDNWLEGLIGVGRGAEIAKARTRIKEVEIEREALIERHARAEATRRRENTESLITLERQVTAQARLLTDAVSIGEQDAEIAAIEQQRLERVIEIGNQYRNQRDQQGHILRLTADQEAQLVRIVERENEISRIQREAAERRRAEARTQGTIEFMREHGTAKDRFDARMAEIEILQQREERLYGDSTIAAERAEIRKRQLYRETAKEAGRTFGLIHDAFINSSSRELKAIAHIADSIRRVQIGAEAALAAVESARQFALVPAALARGAPWAAAFHALSGTQLAAAAALGFREALGSGGGGGAAGGGGVGAGTTFEPDRGVSGGGEQTIILQLLDPDTPSAIGRTMWLMKRNQVLHRQSFIPIRAS